ncbi:Gfo/Idh/MocA family oxidoreductase [Planctomycetota bacterium]
MKKYDRRSFLKASAAVTVAGGFVLPQFSIGQSGASANSKLNIVMIGTGNVAQQALGGCDSENIVALCDVDSSNLYQYADKYPQIKQAATFSDFRVMLDKMDNQIDAVCVSTPDHTHFVATIAAMERGKHVFTQKPLTHNIWETRTLRKAMHKYKVITNMGNQGHTFDGIRRMREWVEAGVFGQITEIHSWSGGPNWKGRYFRKPENYPSLSVDPVPATLHYDLWLGPAKKVPYHKNYHPETWRGFKQFGTGTFGDWFCHISDGPVWILDLYEPVVIEAEKVAGGDGVLNPDGCRVRFDFVKRGIKEACSFYWHNGPGFRPEMPKTYTLGKELPGAGTIYIGKKTTGFTDNRSNNPRLVNLDEMKAFNKAGLPEAKYPRVKGGPIKEWVKAIKEGTQPGSNFDYAAPMTETMLLGVLAVNHGGKIEWDSKNMKITNRPELNVYIKDPVRKGWEYGDDLWT